MTDREESIDINIIKDDKNINYMDEYASFRKKTDDDEDTLRARAAIERVFPTKEGDFKREETVEPNKIKVPELDLPPRKRTFAQKGVAFGKDILKGTLRAPLEAAGGVAEGINEIVSLVERVSDGIDELFGLPPLKKVVSEVTGVDIPEVKLPELKAHKAWESVTGNIIRSISRFAVGFKGVDKILKGLKIGSATTSIGKVAENIGKITAADLLVFNEQENRLADVLANVPVLQNVVPSYLQSDPDDTLAEGKLKQAIEVAALGGAGEALFRGIKALKLGKKLSDYISGGNLDKDKPLSALAQAKKEQEVVKRKMRNIGDPDDVNFILEKRAKAFRETIGIKPEDVQKAAKRSPSPLDEFEINFARINNAEDVGQAMQALINHPALKKSIKEARRGIRTHKKTIEAAADIDGFATLMRRRKGEALNAEQTYAANTFYDMVTAKVREVSYIASLPDASLLDAFNFRKMIALHHLTQQEIEGVKAEGARAFNAWAIPTGVSGEVDLGGIRQIVNDFGGTLSSIDLAKKIASHGKDLNADKINTITNKGAFARTGHALREAWTLGLLTNLTTHSINISSSLLAGFAEIPKRGLQAMFSDSPVVKEEMAYMTLGMMGSWKEAFINGAKAFRSGRTGFSTGKVELPLQRATSMEALKATGPFVPFAQGLDYYGRVMQLAGKGLAAGDEFSRTVLAKGQAHALGAREGVNKGLKGKELYTYVSDFVKNPPPQAMASIKDFAEYNIFIKKLGPWGQLGQRALHKVPVLRLIFPFVRAPTNIFKYTFEHTPLAFLSKNIRSDIRSGGLSRAEAYSKIGLGATCLAMGVDLALSGRTTGQGPVEPKIQRRLRDLGWRPYSLRIGDEYWSYARYEPIATIFGLAADMAEILSNYESYDIAKQDEVDNFVTAGVVAISNQIIGKTFLQGVSDTVEMFADPKRNADRYLQRYAGSIVPAGLAKAARVWDPEVKYVTGLGHAILARLPYASKYVPVRRNVWGEPMETYYPSFNGLLSPAGDLIAAYVNPFYVSKKKDSPKDSFMAKNGFPVSFPSKRQNFNGSMIDLGEYPHIYSRLLDIRGREITLPKYGNLTMSEYFDDLVQSKTLRSSQFFGPFTDYDDQKNFISNVVSDYTKAAKKQLLDEFPVLEQIIFENQLDERKQALELTADTSKHFP